MFSVAGHMLVRGGDDDKYGMYMPRQNRARAFNIFLGRAGTTNLCHLGVRTHSFNLDTPACTARVTNNIAWLLLKLCLGMAPLVCPFPLLGRTHARSGGSWCMTQGQCNHHHQGSQFYNLNSSRKICDFFISFVSPRSELYILLCAPRIIHLNFSPFLIRHFWPRHK